jgi:pimeloyl-ACP methyl ester carboxylesterase
MLDLLRRIKVCILFLLFLQLHAEGQKKVTFTSSDNLTVTADLYLKNKDLPFILLFHQGNYSRGEYKEIAPKLLNLNYNCLSVDLRSGGNVNFVENETSLDAISKKISHSMLDARTDIQAAIQYASAYNNYPVVLFGSSYSASLSLMVANKNPRVKAVVAFSPGEFFRPVVLVSDALTGFDKKAFIAATHAENNYLGKMLSEIPDPQKTVFTPKNSPGMSGAKALWESSADHAEYWLALLMFFKELNGNRIAPSTSIP